MEDADSKPSSSTKSSERRNSSKLKEKVVENVIAVEQPSTAHNNPEIKITTVSSISNITVPKKKKRFITPRGHSTRLYLKEQERQKKLNKDADKNIDVADPINVGIVRKKEKTHKRLKDNRKKSTVLPTETKKTKLSTSTSSKLPHSSSPVTLAPAKNLLKTSPKTTSILKDPIHYQEPQAHSGYKKGLHSIDLTNMDGSGTTLHSPAMKKCSIDLSNLTFIDLHCTETENANIEKVQKKPMIETQTTDEAWTSPYAKATSETETDESMNAFQSPSQTPAPTGKYIASSDDESTFQITKYKSGEMEDTKMPATAVEHPTLNPTTIFPSNTTKTVPTTIMFNKQRNIRHTHLQHKQKSISSIVESIKNKKDGRCTLPVLPKVKSKYDKDYTDVQQRIINLIEQMYTFEEVYDVDESTMDYNNFTRPFEINAIHFFTLRHLKTNAIFNPNGFRLCKQIKKMWDEEKFTDRTYYTTIADLKNEQDPPDWPLEFYHIIDKNYKHSIIKMIEMENPIIGSIAQVVFGFPLYTTSLENMDHKQQFDEISFLKEHEIPNLLSLTNIYGDDASELRPMLPVSSTNSSDNNNQFPLLHDEGLFLATRKQEQQAEFERIKEKVLQDDPISEGLRFDSEDNNVVPFSLSEKNTGVASSLNFIIKSSFENWGDEHLFTRKHARPHKSGPHKSDSSTLYFGNKFNRSIGYMTYDFVEKKLNSLNIEVEIVDRTYLYCMTNNIWIKKRKCSYIIIQGVLRTLPKNFQTTNDEPYFSIASTTTDENASRPDYVEHMIVIDTDTAVYIDHFSRHSQNGNFVLNDMNALHITNEDKSYFRHTKMIVAVYVPHLKTSRHITNEIAPFVDFEKYPIGRNYEKAATAYVLETMDLRKLSYNPFGWHSNGEELSNKYVTSDYLLWCMKERKSGGIATTGSNIDVVWTSEQKDSFLLRGVFDGNEKYLDAFIDAGFPRSLISFDISTSSGKINLQDDIKNSDYLDNLVNTTNGIPTRLNETCQQQPRRATYGVIMPDDNDPVVPNTLCLAKLKDVAQLSAGQPTRPLPLLKFEFSYFVWRTIISFCSLISSIVPPNSIQELFYYGIFPSHINWHCDHLAEDKSSVLKGSNTIVVSFHGPILFCIRPKNDKKKVQEFQLHHKDVLVLGPYTDMECEHMVKFPSTKKCTKKEKELAKQNHRFALVLRWTHKKALFHYDRYDKEGRPFHYTVSKFYRPFKNCKIAWSNLHHTSFFDNVKLVEEAKHKYWKENEHPMRGNGSSSPYVHEKKKRRRASTTTLSPQPSPQQLNECLGHPSDEPSSELDSSYQESS